MRFHSEAHQNVFVLIKHAGLCQSGEEKFTNEAIPKRPDLQEKNNSERVYRGMQGRNSPHCQFIIINSVYQNVKNSNHFLKEIFQNNLHL